jgi:hypothetical protein
LETIMATWTTELPDEAHAGDDGHVADHNALVAAHVEERAAIDAAEKSAAWGTVTGKPSTIGSTATTALAGNTALLQIGTTATTAMAGNTSIPAAYTDAKAQAAIKGKSQIAALAAVDGGADLAAVITAVNAVIAALKA